MPTRLVRPISAVIGAVLISTAFLFGATALQHSIAYGVPAAHDTQPVPQPTGTLDVSPDELELKNGSSGTVRLSAVGGMVTWSARTVPGVRVIPAVGTLQDGEETTVTIRVDSSSPNGSGTLTFGYQGPSVHVTWTTPTTPPTITPPATLEELTIHMYGYPASCATGRIVVNGRALETRLDEADRTAAGPGRWAFIDLHAFSTTKIGPSTTVEADCVGTIYPTHGYTLPGGLPTYELRYTVPTTPVPTPTPALTPTPTPTPRPNPTETTPAVVLGSISPVPSPPATNSAVPAPRRESAPTVGLVRSLRTPSEVSWDIKSLAGAAGLALWFILLVLLLEQGHPGELINATLGRWWKNRRQPRDRRWPVPIIIRMCLFAALGGLLAVGADKDSGLTMATALRALGASAGILIVLVAYEIPKEFILQRARRQPVVLRAVVPGILLAVALAVVSRLLELPVPYVYGLVAVFVALEASRQARLPEGRAVLIAGICVLGVTVAVWLLSEPLLLKARTAPTGSLVYNAAYALGLIVIAGTQAVVFGLMPVEPLDGHKLKQWNTVAWAALYLVGLAFFFHVVLNTLHPDLDPNNDWVPGKDLRWRTTVLASFLFATAWVFSVVLRRAALRRPAP